jgi:rhodanese-related sulfurtransferase
MFRQALFIIVLSIILGLGINTFSPNSIPFIGEYRNISHGDEPVVPPNAIPGDPPFITIDIAEMEYRFNETVFIDARSYDDFVCGTIPNSINIPFDYLPDSNIDSFIDSSLNFISKDTPIIVFCSGDECELSLQLARYLQDFDYTDVTVFYGGVREWENMGLEMKRWEECGE